MAILQPAPKPLKDLFRYKFKVPIYQRVFSWGQEEAFELWDDLINNEPPYFLGIILLRKRKDEKSGEWFEVVDGQQRLATLILLLRAAVENLEENTKERSTLQNQFITHVKFGDDKPEFTLALNERDNDKFMTLLSDNHEYVPARGTRKSISWKNLELVKSVFVEKFAEIKAKKGPDGVINFVRDNLLELTMIDVQLEEESDVYVFFETLNDRGIDLSLADLIKNRVCALPGVDPYNAANKIDRITDYLGFGRMKPFLLHYCWALDDQEPPHPSNKLMEWYKEVIRHEGEDFLKNLDDYAELYHEISEPRKGGSKNKEVLTYLKVLGATRCYPALLVGKKKLSPRQFGKLCNAIEILTVRHSTISKLDAKKLEDVYQHVAKDIRKGRDFKAVLEELKEWAMNIPDEVFHSSFKTYSSPNTQIARYLLIKMENFINGDDVPADWEKLTLEHILARNAEWDGNEEFKERLGNMILLSGTLNTKLGNLPFKDKIRGYAKNTKFELTKQILDYKDFTRDTISDRQAMLADLALKVWNPNCIS